MALSFGRVAATLAGGGMAGVGVGLIEEAKQLHQARRDELDRQFRREESEKDRSARSAEGEKLRGFQAAQAEIDRGFKSEEAGKDREFKADEGEKDRANRMEVATTEKPADRDLKEAQADWYRRRPATAEGEGGAAPANVKEAQWLAGMRARSEGRTPSEKDVLDAYNDVRSSRTDPAARARLETTILQGLLGDRRRMRELGGDTQAAAREASRMADAIISRQYGTAPAAGAGPQPGEYEAGRSFAPGGGAAPAEERQPAAEPQFEVGGGADLGTPGMRAPPGRAPGATRVPNGVSVPIERGGAAPPAPAAPAPDAPRAAAPASQQQRTPPTQYPDAQWSEKAGGWVVQRDGKWYRVRE